MKPEQRPSRRLNDSLVLVLRERDVYDDVQYAKGQTIRLAHEQEPVQNLFFTNDTWYVAAMEQDQAAIMEIDTRTPLNEWRIKVPAPAGFLYMDDAALYWISGTDQAAANVFSS